MEETVDGRSYPEHKRIRTVVIATLPLSRMSLDGNDRVLLHAQLFDTLDLCLQWLSEIPDPATDPEWDKLSGGIIEQLSDHQRMFYTTRERVFQAINKRFPALLQGTRLQDGILNAAGTKGKLAVSVRSLLFTLETLISEPTEEDSSTSS